MTLTTKSGLPAVQDVNMGNEALHPETKHGATGGGHDQSRKVCDSADRFTLDTAKKPGQADTP